MKFNSLKTRMAIAISLLVIALLGGLALLYLGVFTRELRRSITRQQFTMVTALANEIDQRLYLAREEIQVIASSLSPGILKAPGKVQGFLDQHAGSRLFNNGLSYFSAKGNLLAISPFHPEMIGQDFSFRPYFQQTVASAGPVVSDPFYSKQAHGHPILMFTAPVFAPDGDLAGILGGSIDLNTDHFLGRLGSLPMEPNGFVYLLDARGRLILHHDPEGLLRDGIGAGSVPLLDRPLAGNQGRGERLLFAGIPTLSSHKRLQQKEWRLGISYPLAEAFLPVRRAWSYGLSALGIGTLLSIITVWLLMQRLTAPLLLLAGQVRRFGEDPERAEPIAVGDRDEIGHLAQAFNHLRQQVVQRSQALETAYDFHLGLLDDFPTLIWRTDRRGSCDYLNRTWLLFTGRDRTDAEGEGWLASVPPEDQKRWRDRIRDMLIEPAPFSLEFRLRRDDGSWRWILAAARPFNDLAGQFAGYLISGLDITERRLLLDQLRRLSLAVEQSPAAVIITNTRGEIEYVNPTFSQSSGFTAEEVLGRDLGFLRSEETPAADFHRIRHDLLRGQSWRGEFRSRRKSGGLYWEAVTISPVRDGRGNFTHFVAVAMEITRQKQAQENSVRREKLLESTNEAVLRFLQTGRVVDLAGYLVESCRGIFGAAGGLFCDLEASELLAKAGNLPDKLERFFTGEESGRSNLPSCCRDLLTQVEQEKSILVNGPPADQAEGPPPAAFTSVLAIPLKIAQETLGILALFDKPGGFSENDRRLLEGFAQTAALALQSARAEKGRRETAESLRVVQKFEAIGQLAGGVAHDFNNLLTVINGYCSLLLRALENGSEEKADAEMIYKAGRKAEDLTRQLLAFSRQQVLEPVLLDLNERIGNFQKIMRRLLRENIELHLQLADPLAPVLADPGQIEQILLNLIVNARDAMPDGGIITVETTNIHLDEEFVRRNPGSVEGDFVLIRVTDTGTGMPEEICSRIFEPFFTTKPKGEGTGLGLSTVYGIVKQSGGYITVTSAPGTGTTFRIYLPSTPGDRALIEEERHSLLPGGTETVLVVEDEGAVLELTAELLRKQGYRVLTAADGGEALQVCDRDGDSIDLLLTDLGMPGLGGAELARRLRGRRGDLKILFMSGYSEFHSGGLPEDFASTGFLQKPFTPEALIGKVQEVLQQPLHGAEVK